MTEQEVRVLIATSEGEIEVALDAARAPRTTANFLRYIDEGYYTPSQNARFYRTVTLNNQPNDAVRIEVIQGGLGLDQISERGQSQYPPIAMEPTSLTGLRHLDGTISMGRLGPDSATSEFFICINDQPELDYGGQRNSDGQGFAAFGRVVRGQAVVRRIQQMSANDQWLNPPVAILSIKRV